MRKFHFFSNYLFSPLITQTHTPTHTHSIFRPIMPKKGAEHLFLKNFFFFALYSFSLTRKHFLIIFSGKLTTKNRKKKLPKGEKKKFFFFYNLFHIFPLPLRKKNKTTYFFRPFCHRKYGNRKEKTPHNQFFFFFLLFCILPFLVIGKITTYLFFRNSNLKYPKMPLSALKFQFFTNYLFPAVITRKHTHTQTHSLFPTHNT